MGDKDHRPHRSGGKLHLIYDAPVLEEKKRRGKIASFLLDRIDATCVVDKAINGRIKLVRPYTAIFIEQICHAHPWACFSDYPNPPSTSIFLYLHLATSSRFVHIILFINATNKIPRKTCRCWFTKSPPATSNVTRGRAEFLFSRLDADGWYDVMRESRWIIFIIANSSGICWGAWRDGVRCLAAKRKSARFVVSKYSLPPRVSSESLATRSVASVRGNWKK